MLVSRKILKDVHFGKCYDSVDNLIVYLFLSSLLQASFVLVPTLGLTWILGFLVVGNDTFSAIIDWLFLICTTTQGITLFIIHCVINTEVYNHPHFIIKTYIQVRVAFLRAIGCREVAKKQKSIFQFKPTEAINSVASYTRRRLSLGNSRRGSFDQPPLSTNKEVQFEVQCNT